MTGAGHQPAPLQLEAAPMWGGFFVLADTAHSSGEGMSHKYKIHQLVRLAHPSYSDKRVSASGIYEVTRLMPADQTGEVSYRIKSSDSGERAVRESEIATRLLVV
jgi:hypothetical protein